ncbi:MAG: hypothetical protein HUJ61_07490 [Bacilli bacterium]|nr:hypothetical protein [Bacilli bacterium]
MHAVNMDNETVTTQTAASMGGNNNSISLTLENDVSHNYVIPTPQSENLQFFEFNATGFQGGHSGIEYGKGKAHPYTLLMDAINT